MTRITGVVAGWRKLSWSAVVLTVAMGLACSRARAHSEDKPPAPAAIPAQAATAAKPAATQKQNVQQNYLRQPLSFEPNQGQTDKRVQFLSHGAGYSLFLTPADAVLSLQAPAGKTVNGKMAAARTAALEMVTFGGNKHAPATGLEPAASHSNYFIGNDPSRWHSDVPNFARVKYQGIYPGIDLTYYGNQSRLEYDFVVSPGADPGKIQLRFKGMQRLRLDSSGELVIDTAVGQVRFERPVVYQERADGGRDAVEGSFAISRNEVCFKVGAYDRSRALVIDPVLGYSTYLGGTGQVDSTFAGIAVNGAGSAYVTGTTNSLDFPLAGALHPINAAGTTGLTTFVTRFNAAGTAIVYSTYLGGQNTGSATYATGIAVDTNGNAFVAGYTNSHSFPTGPGTVFQNAYTVGSGSDCGYVASLNLSGVLNYSTYFCASLGNGNTQVYAIAVDTPVGSAPAHAFITGTDQGGLPFSGTVQPAIKAGASENAFVAELNSIGTALVYGTYVGGSIDNSGGLGADDIGYAIAVDANGAAYITGFTSSTDFPLAPSGSVLQSTNKIVATTTFAATAFVTKVHADGTSLMYSTYLGGTGKLLNGSVRGDQGNAIAVDSAGSAYVTGSTYSSDFPTAFQAPATAPFQGSNLSGANSTGDTQVAFVSKLNPAGTALVYSTYLGGSTGNNSGQGIAVDAAGDAYVTGHTSDLQGSVPFPTVNPLYAPGSNPLSAFVTEFDPTGSTLIYSTFFGNTQTNAGFTYGLGIALDASDNAYIAGVTAAGIPVTSGAFQATFPSTITNPSSGFVAKLWPLAVTTNPATTPAALNFPNTVVGSTSAPLSLTLLGTGVSGGAVLLLSNPTLSGPDAGDFQGLEASSSCFNSGQVEAQGSCNYAFTFAPSAVGGPFTATFTVQVTDADGVTQPVTFALAGTGTAATAQAVLNPTPLIFPDTPVGTTSLPMNLTVTNKGPAPLHITGVNIPANSGFTIATGATQCVPPITLAATNGNCLISVNFTPTTATALTTSTLTITDDSGGPAGVTQTATLSGQGVAPQALLTPSVLTFSAAVGTTSAPQTITLSNPGNAALNISPGGITFGGANANEFSLAGSATPSTCFNVTNVAPGGSCTIIVVFTPTTVGAASATISVADNATGSPQIAMLSGTGTIAPQVSLTPTTLTFNSPQVGTASAAQTVTLTNTGNAVLSTTHIVFTGGSGFSQTNNCSASVVAVAAALFRSPTRPPAPLPPQHLSWSRTTLPYRSRPLPSPAPSPLSAQRRRSSLQPHWPSRAPRWVQPPRPNSSRSQIPAALRSTSPASPLPEPIQRISARQLPAVPHWPPGLPAPSRSPSHRPRPQVSPLPSRSRTTPPDRPKPPRSQAQVPACRPPVRSPSSPRTHRRAFPRGRWHSSPSLSPRREELSTAPSRCPRRDFRRALKSLSFLPRSRRAARAPPASCPSRRRPFW